MHLDCALSATPTPGARSILLRTSTSPRLRFTARRRSKRFLRPPAACAIRGRRSTFRRTASKPGGASRGCTGRRAISSEAPPPELEIIRVTTPAEVEDARARQRARVLERREPDDRARNVPSTVDPRGPAHGPVARASGGETGRRCDELSHRRSGGHLRRDDDPDGATARVRRRAHLVALLSDTGLPAVLAPSPEGEPVYARLGFERVGELLIWSRKA